LPFSSNSIIIEVSKQAIGKKQDAQSDPVQQGPAEPELLPVSARGKLRDGNMTLQLRPETEARLEAIAAARGLSTDAFVEALVEREVLSEASGSLSDTRSSGMVQENGLRVYRTGNPLPPVFIDDAVRRSREERSLHILGYRP
jgi:hypothetical protein